jgi:hypothetical protein
VADHRGPGEHADCRLAGILTHTHRATLGLLTAAGLILAPAHAADLLMEATTVEGTGWRAEGVALALVLPHDLQLRVATLAVAGRPLLRRLQLHCRRLQAGAGARCDDAAFRATLAGGSLLKGRLQARFDHPRRWHAQLDTARLRATLDQDGDALAADITAAGLDYSEPAGRYAAEKLSATTRLRWDGRRLELALDAKGGQAYAEPVFFDFGALPLRVTAAIARTGTGWRIERLGTTHGSAGSLALSGLLDSAFQPVELDARLEARDLAPLLATGVAPFLVGTQLEGLGGSGAATATLVLRKGAPRAFAARLDGASVNSEKLGASLEGLVGELNWAAAASAASRLQWRGGSLKRVPLGPSGIAFSTRGKDFALTAPWRQPLLGGALSVARLALRDLGGARAAAEFDGALEPIDLAALCKALGWPEFGGTLGGRLPGVKLRDDAWSIEGALEAQAFDGSIRIDNLGVVGLFGLQPRVTADVKVRGLDLERVTRAFSFGRISGRLDGDVAGLRLLDWSPVAFDARLYSTPGYGGTRRISQRAIDSLSSIGGAPGGALSRGFLGLFDDFAYARLGIGCVLRDGVCEMDGVEPAQSAGGAAGYYLVKGRLLPRIDVVGYARRVSWDSLVGQLKAAQASEGPRLEQKQQEK